ncbi:RsmB/NOP family class I SAM-dependent RNA methyltransferase [Jannaschia sp. R86511]|uniref:RsmB/NOP family class I SAM-dependent RNA methyltransferase n=1 Tax=Jannaschia sp. R86511 TaxID=3093853 RepID=UPI0036D387BB
MPERPDRPDRSERPDRPDRGRPDRGRPDGTGAPRRGGPPGPRRDGGGPDRAGRAPARERLRGSDAPRTVAFRVLRQVGQDDAYANLVLPGALSREGLVGRDAAFATELTYGTLRLQGLYDQVLARVVDRPLDKLDPPTLDVLRLGAHQLLSMRVPDHAAVASTVGLARQELGIGSSGLVNACLRKITDKDLAGWLDEIAPADGEDRDATLATRHSHPQWIVRALRQALVGHGRAAEELEDLLAADNAPADVSLLARPGLIEVADLLADGGSAGAWSPFAVTMAAGSPGGLRAVRDSRARVQDEGSQLVAAALVGAGLDDDEPRDVREPDPGRSGERWLDLCAGPGGKSSLLSALAMRDGATGVAVELAEHRTRLVEQAVRGAERVWQVRTGDGREVGEDEPGGYDRVLVDAPCTGLGALRRRPEARWRRTPGDLAGLAQLQRSLLASGLQAARPGGVVAYVTCSPHLAETTVVVEDAVRAARKQGVEVELLPTAEVLDAAVGRPVTGAAAGTSVQLWPHAHGTDGMFLALLRRR